MSLAKCPECGSKLPFGSHVSFNQFIGIECPNCGSVLTHKNGTFLAKLALIIAVIYSFSRIIDGNLDLTWVLLFFSSLGLLILLQISLPFIVKFGPK